LIGVILFVTFRANGPGRRGVSLRMVDYTGVEEMSV
jgi:hypothetical protein